MTRVLVTGVQGYLGRYLFEDLMSVEGLDVIGLTRMRCADRNREAPDRVFADLEDLSSVRAALEEAEPDVLIHAAGRVVGTSAELFRDNARATANLADAIAWMKSDVQLITIGSAAEYGPPLLGRKIEETHECRPLSAYGHAKLAATNYLLTCARDRGLRVNVLRLFNVIAPTNSTSQVIGSFIERAADAYNATPPRVITMGRLDAIRDFVSIFDFFVAIRTLLKCRPVDDPIINVCSGYGHRVRDLIEYLNRISGFRYTIEESRTNDGHEDIVVGDPTKFKRLTGIPELRSIYKELERSWELATTERLR